MKRIRKALTMASQYLDLPGEVAAGQPKIEVTGTTTFSMEPHRGLLEYGTEEILIASNIGPICIRGKNLSIQLMNRQRITVIGEIQYICLTESDHE